MKIEQNIWRKKEGWAAPFPSPLCEKAGVVFVFGATHLMKNKTLTDDIKNCYKNAHIIGCSSAGEIASTSVMDDSLTVTAASFDKTEISCCSVKISGPENSFSGGEEIAEKMAKNNLKHLFVLSDGLAVNGSELVRGLSKKIQAPVTITGGLAGDGENFKETYILSNEGAEKNSIRAVGFYGNHIRTGAGSYGGWDPFGPERLVTKSKGNILYELDWKPALDLYKKYLGEYAASLPSSGLLFPLSIREKDKRINFVRTILGIGEKEQSLIFAGDIPEGSYARMMKANFDRLIDGAVHAAKESVKALKSEEPQLAILISCIGRKLILKQRVEEEVEGVQEIMGNKAVLTGFYSYGEIAPYPNDTKCALHNQTMTVTTFMEI